MLSLLICVIYTPSTVCYNLPWTKNDTIYARQRGVPGEYKMKNHYSIKVKWKTVTFVLLFAMVAQLIPSQFADYVWMKVGASEGVTNSFDYLPESNFDCSSESNDSGIIEIAPLKGLLVNGELTDLRTKNSKTYRLSDGSFYNTTFSYPIHIERDNHWVDVNNALYFSETGPQIKNADGAFDVSFPAVFRLNSERTEDNMIYLSGDSGSIAYKLSFPGLSQRPYSESFAEISTTSKSADNDELSVLKHLEELPGLESGLKYNDVTDGISLEYTVTPGGIKENIIIESVHSPEMLEQGILYSINAGDLVPELIDNRIVFLNGSGQPMYTFYAPLMYDGRGEISTDLTLRIDDADNDNGNINVMLSVDANWILDSNRVFPVVIDPEITVEGSDIIDSVATLDTSNNSVSSNVAIVGENKHAMVRLNWPQLPLFSLPVEADFVVNHGITVNYSDCYLSASALNENWTVSSLSNGIPAHEYYPFQHFHHPFYASSTFTLDVTSEAKKNYVYNQNFGFMIESTGLLSQVTVFYASNIETTVLTLRYLNYQGLEDQWNTHAASVTDISGTIYVKDAFGDFVYVHNDLCTPGDILPLSVSHIFNITNGNIDCGYGKGFRLSLIRTLEYNSDIDGYIYTDEDGTKHYFNLSAGNTYSLEENPSLKIEIDTVRNVPFIIWPDKSTLTFEDVIDDNIPDDLLYATEYKDYRGLTQTFTYDKISTNIVLTSATDGAGNYLQFNYSLSGILTSMNVNGSSTRTLSFEYDSNKLSRITYPDSTYTQFYSTSRTVNGTAYYYPKRIVDPSGVMMRVAVSSGTLRVSKVYKKAAGSGDSTVVDAEYATFEYEPSRTTVKHGFGTHQTYAETISFDCYGRAVNAVDDRGNVVLVNYDDNNVFNNINRSHSELTAGPNYLKDSSFELSSVSNWTSYTGSIANVTTSGTRFPGLIFGSKCFSVFSIQGSGYAGYTQNVSLSAGTYTASAYCDATSGTGSGGAIIAFLYNDSNSVTQKISSIPEKGNSRIQVIFTVPEGVTSQKILLGTYDFTGTVYFDAIQLEEGGRASYYNGVENGGALYSTAGNWNGNISQATTDGRSGYVLRIDGDYHSSKYASQQINISKSNMDKQYMRISGWYKAPSYFNSRNAYIQVSFYNASGNLISGKSKAIYPDNNLTGWQYLSESFYVDFEFSYAKIWLNNYGPGYVYFDDVSLTAETSYEDFDNDTEYTYDQNGWLKTETAPDRSEKEYTYCTDSNSSLFGQVTLTELTDKSGNVTSTQYNYTDYYTNVFDLSSAISVYSPANDDLEPVTTITEYKYGGTYNLLPEYLGHPTSVITKVSEGNNSYQLTECKTIAYDTDTMLTEREIDIWNNITEYSYNAYGELTSVTENGTVTTYTYDSMGRMTETTGKARVDTTNNSTVSVSFAYNSEKISMITRTNSYYGFTYDSLGRTLSVTVNRTYGGNTSSTTIANYTYSSSNGLVSRLTYGNSSYKDYSYNTSGQVTSVDYSDTSGTDYTNAYSNAGDVITNYNSLDNLTKNYSYDWLGRPVYTSFSNGRSLKFTYLDKNNETSVTFRGLASQPDKFTYKSYLTERFIETTVAGNVTAFSYRYADEYGRLSNIDIGDNNYRLKTSYSYLSAGTYIENGTYTSFDKLSGRIGTVSYLKETVSSGATAAVSGLPTLTYTYDAKDNIETISEGGIQKVKYYYDAQNQLIREDNKYLNNGTGYTVEYRYNADGNMTAKLLYTYTTNSTFPTNPLSTINMGYSASNGWRDQMTSYNGNTITYDGAGNMLSYNNGAAMTLTWTQGNRLASVSKTGTSCSFIYDESGYRTRKTVGSTTYTYTWDGSRLVSQDTGTAGSEIVFLYDDTGNMFGFRKSGTVYYYAKNLQGDVIAIFVITGDEIDVVAKYTYDSWGKLISIKDGNGNDITNNTSTIGYINPIRYRGYYYDTESGLYYLKSRYYDPEINRFISADVLVSTGQRLLGFNMYIYCENNPANAFDPDGKFLKEFIKKYIEIIVKPSINITKELLSNVDLTLTSGLSGMVGSLFGVADAQIGVSVDTKGNVGFQFSFALGFTLVPSTASVTAFNSFTNAKEISYLSGPFIQEGGSYGFPIGYFPASAGIDITHASHKNEDVFGLTGSFGAGSPGPDAHFLTGVATKPMLTFNIFDEIINWCNTVIEWCT